MPSLFRPLIALGAALAVASQAQALTLDNVVANGNVVNTDFVLPGQIGLDLAFLSQAPVSLSFTLDASDGAGTGVWFNAVVREVSGAALSQVRLALSGGAFFSGPAGSAFTLAGVALAPSLTAGNTQVALLASPATAEIYLGNPLGLPGPQDWQIAYELASGPGFTLTVTQVPEPQTWALLLGGLGGLLVMARRRQLG